MSARVQVQNATTRPTPDQRVMRSWVDCTLARAGYQPSAELSVRIVEDSEMQALNRHYRGQDKSTNVLSFTAELPAELELPLLGDIVICAPVVEREAQEQGKTHEAHWAHMLVHGTLHLLGYEHQSDAEATTMEALETAILTSLALPPPYAKPPPTTEKT